LLRLSSAEIRRIRIGRLGDLRDLNGNGISERGEVMPLAEWGIVAISGGYLTDMKRSDRIAFSPQGVFFRDVSNRPTYDVILDQAIAIVD
jgi:hypothetical protein